MFIDQTRPAAARRNEAPNIAISDAGADIFATFDAMPGTALIDDVQVASLCGVKRLTVKSWRQRGIGPKFVYVHGRARAYVRDVREWLAGLPRKTTQSTRSR